ncbi:dynein regulatory complex protein 11-like [Thrips palmi]|uniref:Dynein regulatory complex protein 11-like n=1 Tax=Thrips palmi TaxID=161013 RepID=A0A6P8Z0C1_THRPL|nr:dynein regulatory complex protein 11-like [Thrips palmi]
MSHATYNAMWWAAQADLHRLTAKDRRLQRRQRETDKRASLAWVVRLYADYIRITRRLDEVHDQLVHPQKRILIRRLLDGCIGRLLELKHELYTELDKSNFHYMDDLLIEQKLTHQDLEVPSPRYYRRENEPELQARREFVDRVLAKMAAEAEKGSAVVAAEAVAAVEAAEEAALAGLSKGGRARRMREMLQEQHEAAEQEPADQRALREAVHLIQMHERARQNRIQSFNRRKWMEQRYQQPTAKKDRPSAERQHAAAVEIQRHYRGHVARRRVRKYREKEDTLVGMLMPRSVDYSYKARIEEVQALRRKLRRDLQAAYEATIVQEREWVDRVLSPDIFDDIGDEMRDWVQSWYYDVKKLPKYPPGRERKLAGTLLGLPRKTPKDMFPVVDTVIPGVPPRKLGGSNLVTADFWCTSTEFKEAAEKLAKDKKKGKGGKAAKTKLSREEKKEQRAKRREAKKAEKQRKLADKQRGFQLEESAVMPALGIAEQEYRVDWEQIRPPEDNPLEELYVDLIRDEEIHAKQFEVRQAIDDLMRAELEKLKEAVWREKNKRRKRKRKRKKKGKKRKKKKKGKRRGKKKKKDLTADKTTDELLEMLVRAGVVRNSAVACMEDFFGEPAYCNFELRERLKDPLPTLGDIRQAVREFCILPLGSRRAHELAPLVKSVLLAGPPLCGKSLLADIVCTETGALRIDLTPEAVAAAREKFPAKKEWKLFLHVVNKVARLLAPTVIVMDNAHRNYYKRVPKAERPLKPKKFARTLKKIVKGIKKPDQVLVLGLTNEPWKARGRRLVKAYQRHVFVPPLDYGSRFLLWHKFIMEHHGVDRNFEVTPLAHVTEWVPLPTIREVVNRVLSVERRIHLDFRPLRQQEVLTALLEFPPVPPVKERAKWLKWWGRTPIQKKRAKVLEEWQKAAESEKGGGGKNEAHNGEIRRRIKTITKKHWDKPPPGTSTPAGAAGLWRGSADRGNRRQKCIN